MTTIHIALLLAMVCVARGLSSVQGQSGPPAGYSWQITWATGITASLIALQELRLTNRSHLRIYGSLTLGLCTIGCWLPLVGFFQVNHDYCWPVIVVLGLIMIVGSALCGLRVIPIATSLFLIVWFYGIVVPPSTIMPTVRQADGIRCVLKSPQELDFQTLSGQDISRVIDESRVETRASVGWLVRATSQPRRRFTLEIAKEHGRDRSFVAMNTGVQKPSWSRSMDLQVTVQRWPETPACELKVPIDPAPKEETRASGGGFDVSTGPVQTDGPKDRSLIFNLTYARKISAFNPGTTPPPLLTGDEFGIVDDLGHRLEPLLMGTATKAYDDGFDPAVCVLLRIDGIDPKAKFIKIQVYRDEEMASHRTVFEFDRVP
ncbi:MAG: hypothetical protein P4L46_16655 [Fimbriimonas sp.]|nr:hypothetical protein [Fimbriimonas sp.]